MRRAAAIERLKALEHDLRSQGVGALYLFGSTARDDACDNSDIDLLFDVAPNARFSLFDQARIGRRLSERLRTKVEFLPRRALHPVLRPEVEAEQVRVFG